MSQVVALTGRDTIIINGRVLNQLADGDCAVLTFPNDLMNVKTGKNGNSIYAFNESGKQVEVDLRLILAGDDDNFMNAILNDMENQREAFVLMTGEFIKNIGDGAGNVKQVIYQLSGGVVEKGIETKENAEGDTDQALAMYKLAFSNAPRTIG